MATRGRKPFPDHLKKTTLSTRVLLSDVKELERIGKQLGMTRSGTASLILNLGIEHWEYLLKSIFAERTRNWTVNKVGTYTLFDGQLVPVTQHEVNPDDYSH